MVCRALAAATLGSMLGCASADPVALAGRIALPGTTGRLDHLARDPTSDRLFPMALDAAGGRMFVATPQRAHAAQVRVVRLE